jgi:lactate permease
LVEDGGKQHHIHEIGLERQETAEPRRGPLLSVPVLVALTPLIVTVVILLVTRIPILGLRGLLTSPVPNLPISLGGLGELTISPSLVVQLRNILGQGLDWSHAILYVPSIIPFLLTAVLAFLLFRSPTGTLPVALHETVGRIGKPVIALFGALVFVNLLMIGGDRASTIILGDALASVAGGLGSILPRSRRARQLLFRLHHDLESHVWRNSGFHRPGYRHGPGDAARLAVRRRAMGNRITIHNIVAVCAVLSLVNVEGEILKKAFLPVILYGITLAAAAAVLFWTS